MKNNKGITLIALIITIIVMLILVAVTVSVVINSNLIGTAKGAKTNTELKYQEEANMSGLNVSDTPYDSVQEYVNTITGNGGAGDDELVIEGSIKIANNPTHVIYVLGTPYLIDSSTKWSDLETCEEPVILTWEEEYWNGVEGLSSCLVNGNQMGTMCLEYIIGISEDHGLPVVQYVVSVEAPFLTQSTNENIDSMYNELILESNLILVDLSNEESKFGYKVGTTFSSDTLTLKECLEEANDNLVYAVAIEQLED